MALGRRREGVRGKGIMSRKKEGNGIGEEEREDSGVGKEEEGP